MIKLTNIVKKYKNGDAENIALNNFSLELPDKGLVAIVGSSGCGKSTLLNVIGGLDSFDSGEMSILGTNVKSFNSQDWCAYRNQYIGFVFQNYYLIPHLNVKENILLSANLTNSNRNYDEDIKRVLKQVGLEGYEKRMPKTLSGGQAQRVAIARAIINKPAIILADEPTGALDKKNSVTVLKALKEISKETLVVLVTHDEKLSSEYADRIVGISYGSVVSDTNKEETDARKHKIKLKRTRLPSRVTLKWALGSAWRKKSRTIPLIIAGAIGFLAVGIVLSMTDSVNAYTIKAQEASLQKYPVAVYCYLTNSAEGHADHLTQFPDEESIIIEKVEYTDQDELPYIQKELNDFMNEMPAEYYTGKYTNGKVFFNMLTEYKDSYKLINNTNYFSKFPSNQEFIETQYDLIKGSFPKNKNELLLCIDSYNRVDVSKLAGLGFDTTQDKISFSDVIGKEYKYVRNNDYYYPIEIDDNRTVYGMKGSSDWENMYNSENALPLKIVGIVRDKSTDSALFTTPLLYTEDLASLIVNECHESDIVKKQIEYFNNASDGEIINVFTGEPFGKSTSSTYNLTSNYQYEENLIRLGNEEYATILYFCTSTYEDRLKISDYFSQFQQRDEGQFKYKVWDYLESVSSSLSGIVNTFSTILLVFSLAAVIVSMLLTMVLTYISVLERFKEIGLLKSIGARRIDIIRMFLTENLIIGIASGIFASILGVLLTPTLGNIVVSMIKIYDTEMLTSVPIELGTFSLWVVPLIFAGAIISSLLASLVPSLIGSKKEPAEILRA